MLLFGNTLGSMKFHILSISARIKKLIFFQNQNVNLLRFPKLKNFMCDLALTETFLVFKSLSAKMLWLSNDLCGEAFIIASSISLYEGNVSDLSASSKCTV